jgi:hypothetical protein
VREGFACPPAFVFDRGRSALATVEAGRVDNSGVAVGEDVAGRGSGPAEN